MEKSPFYKQAWFWILVIGILLVLIGIVLFFFYRSTFPYIVVAIGVVSLIAAIGWKVYKNRQKKKEEEGEGEEGTGKEEGEGEEGTGKEMGGGDLEKARMMEQMKLQDPHFGLAVPR